jgi:hypothetical protein
MPFFETASYKPQLYLGFEPFYADTLLRQLAFVKIMNAKISKGVVRT